MGHGVKPSFFTMCNFHDLEINIYWGKIRGITFWASLVIFSMETHALF
jgi:hypothetical protein